MEPALPVLPAGTPGDPGIYGPGSAAWHIGRERALLLAGGAVLMLQIAHPLVAAGVVDHSDFRRDPFARLRATLETMLQITFGDRAQAQAAAGRANAVHDRVHGRLRERAGSHPRGTQYRATDPELALWVHATLVFAALDGYAWFVGPLSEHERSRYYEETKAQAALFGVARSYLPESYADFQAYLFQMMDGSLLTGRGDAGSLASAIFEPRAPFPLRAVARRMRTASTAFLPERLRHEFDLPWGLRERAGFRSVAAALRAALPLIPHHMRFWPHYDMALRRMGIPHLHLGSQFGGQPHLIWTE